MRVYLCGRVGVSLFASAYTTGRSKSTNAAFSRYVYNEVSKVEVLIQLVGMDAQRIEENFKVRLRACVRACVRACMRASVRVRAYVRARVRACAMR
jgi:hypothetical protein